MPKQKQFFEAIEFQVNQLDLEPDYKKKVLKEAGELLSLFLKKSEKDVRQDFLDEIVHDFVADEDVSKIANGVSDEEAELTIEDAERRASRINNEGPVSQILHILIDAGVEDGARTIREALES